MTRGRSQPTYAQLLETNNLIQQIGDNSLWLCLTRTVQESKLYPVSAYILLSYLNAFYRYPELLRKIEEQMPAEDIGDRSRNMGIKLQNSHVSWCLPAFYLLGREMLIEWGMIRPQDAIDDVIYVLDFWKRFMLSWHRNNGHMTNAQAGQRSQILPDRTLEVFKADLHDCQAGDELQEAANAFMATASQYGFLVSCESRISLTNSGPYRIDDDHQMLIRDFMDLAECSLPWLDGVAADVPYNNLTVVMSVRGSNFHIVDDWGSFEAEPAFAADRLVGVGLYTSDPLSEGHVPIAMGSREELVEALVQLNAVLRDATNKLWVRMAGWSRETLLDAGALTYFSACKDLAHVAGVYEVSDWMEIDPRAGRFRNILNDEYSNQFLGELVAGLTLPSQARSPFTMVKLADRPAGMMTPLPYSVLAGDDYAPTAGAVQAGSSLLPPKEDRYRTTRGIVSLKEYNRMAREFVPAVCAEPYRHLCETWVKYNSATPEADELYRLAQRGSRNLEGRGCARESE